MVTMKASPTVIATNPWLLTQPIVVSFTPGIWNKS